MRAKLSLVALALLVLFGLIAPAPVLAAGPRVLAISAEVTFPTMLSFKIRAQSEVNITDIRLEYRVDRSSFTDATAEGFVSFISSTSVQGGWDWDLRKTGGLPPGTVIHYWWVVTDAADNTVQTQARTVTFDDKRYEWRTLSEDKVVLHWYKGDDTFAGKLMTAAHDALDRMSRDTGASLAQTVNLYIYGSSQDLRGSMIFPQDWTGGVAYSSYNSIAIGINTNQLDWGTSAIAHELTHLLVYQMTANPYNELPTWLNEGLAMYAEGSLDPTYMTLLNGAISQDSLISVRSLVSPFSAYGSLSALAYAESYSLVEFLVDEYGQARMSELLDTFKGGSGYDEAFTKVYGFDMEELDSLWRQSLSMAPSPAISSKPAVTTLPGPVITLSPAPANPPQASRPGVAVVVLVLLIVALLLAAIIYMARKWVWKR